MPTKKPQDRKPKRAPLVWETEDGAKVTIPLRLPMSLIEEMGDEELSTKQMLGMLKVLIPNQWDVVREMDLQDFEEMFDSWQKAYAERNGASVGEASGSPA